MWTFIQYVENCYKNHGTIVSFDIKWHTAEFPCGQCVGGKVRVILWLVQTQDLKTNSFGISAKCLA